MRRGFSVPEIEGEGCLLRPWHLDDAGFIRLAACDPVIPTMTTVPAYGSWAECEAFIEQQWAYSRCGLAYAFAICVEPAIGHPVGYAGLWPLPQDRARAQIGCWVLAERRGAGVATRALSLLSSWAMEHAGIDRLELLADPNDAGLIKVARRVGFSREGKLRNAQRVGRERHDRVLYGRLRKVGGDGGNEPCLPI